MRRPVHLYHAATTHVTRDGLFVPSEGDGSSVAASAELETLGATAAAVVVRFTLFGGPGSGAAAGRPIATATTATVRVPAAGAGAGSPAATVTASARLVPGAGAITPWTTKAPHLYTMQAEVSTVAT